MIVKCLLIWLNFKFLLGQFFLNLYGAFCQHVLIWVVLLSLVHGDAHKTQLTWVHAPLSIKSHGILMIVHLLQFTENWLGLRVLLLLFHSATRLCLPTSRWYIYEVIRGAW